MRLVSFAYATALFAVSNEKRPRRRHSSSSSSLATTISSSDDSSTITQQELPTPSTSTPTTNTNKYDALLAWMRSNDAVIRNIEFKPSSRGGGYGAFVTEAVEQGELLFTIPRKLCVTVADAMNDPKCGKAFSTLIEKAGPGGNTVAMAGFLAKAWLEALEDVQQGKDLATSSSFGPYLATLPWKRGVNSQEHMLYWSDDDIESLLTGTMCYEEAVALRQEVAFATTVVNGITGKAIREYRGEEVKSNFKWPWEIFQESPEEADNDNEPEIVKGLSEAVIGAFVSLLTRSFQDGDDEDSSEKLVPLLDMLQHSDEPNISHGMRKEDGTVEGRACRAISAGGELLNQYRSEREDTMPYHRFFTRYGFVPGIQEPVENLLQEKSSIFFAQTAEI